MYGIPNAEHANVFIKQKIFGAFVETAALIHPEGKDGFGSRSELVQKIDEKYRYSACYIKSAYQEFQAPNTCTTTDPFGFIIACAGPQVHNVDNFWKIVHQNNVTKIINLCESDPPETCQYVPDPEAQDDDFAFDDSKLTFGDLKVANHKETHQEHATVRQLSMYKNEEEVQ